MKDLADIHVTSRPVLPVLEAAMQLLRPASSTEALSTAFSELLRNRLGFGVVALHLYRPAWDDFEVVAVAGRDEVRRALLGSTSAHEDWARLLEPRSLQDGVHVIRHGELTWDAAKRHAEDALLVPMWAADGHLLGVASLAEPAAAEVPDSETLHLISLVCGMAAVAIEQAQHEDRQQADRKALDRLSRIAPLLGAKVSLDATLAAVCEELRSALAFDRVAIELLDGDGQRLRPAASAGWPPNDPELEIDLAAADCERLFETAGLREGCVLVLPEQGRALAGDRSPTTYSSRLNGRGPYSWQRHWLLAPLRLNDGTLRGFVWVEDPVDRLIPTDERLQVLRLFADQVATALTLAEQFDAIQTTNEARAALVSAAPIGIVELDLDRRVRSWNAAAESIFGWSAEEVVGRRNPIVPDEDWEDHVSRTAAVLEGATIDAVRRRYRADSAPVDVRLRTVPITDSSGVVTGMLVLAEDITERVRAEEELRSVQELHRRIVENAADFITLIDRTGCVVLGGLAPGLGDEAAGDPPAFTDRIHPDDRKAAAVAVTQALAGAPPTPVELRVADEAGGWRFLEGVAVGVPDAHGAIEFALTVTRDVTERRQAESERAQASRLETVGRLTAGIAHDFNNLLMVIGGYGELAQAELESVDHKAAESIHELLQATRQAADLTRHLLAFSRQQLLRLQPTNLNAVVTATDRLLRPLLGAGVTVRLDLQPDLGICHADRGQLEQVLVNLALNARDAMDGAGALTIATRNVTIDEEWATGRDGARPGDAVLLAVSDTGHGIEPDTLARIFEPFFSTKPVGSGHGLGLASVYGIVKQSGGYLDVESTVGVGTTFRLYLPTSHSGVATDDDTAASEPSRATHATIALVDDDDTVRAVTEQLLIRQGHSVTSFPSGEAVLQWLDDHDGAVDLLITDLAMPDMDGCRLASHVSLKHPHVRILVITGLVNHDDRALTDVAILEKPFTHDALAAAIEATLAGPPASR